MRVKKKFCQCHDKGCPIHKGNNCCSRQALYTLYRVDMQDSTGTDFCTACASDAMESGIFTDETEDTEDNE